MRSLWIGTLAAALSCTAPGWSQVLQPDRWIMVREEGKPAVKCRVISTKKQKDGSSLCQAKTESGESITLLEEPVKGMPSGTMRMRVMPRTSDCTTCAPMPGVAQPPSAPSPVIGPTPTGTPPTLKPVPPPTFVPAVVKATPEVKKENTSMLGRFFNSTPAKSESARASDTKEVVKNSTGVRPQLPVSVTSTDDPLNRPELYSKHGMPGFNPAEQTKVVVTAPTKTVTSVPSVTSVPTIEPAKPTLIGRVFTRVETPVIKNSVETNVETKVVTRPSPVVETSESRPGIFARLQTGSTPRTTVVQAEKEVTPGIIERMRARMATVPATKPVSPPRYLLSGLGSVAAARDRGTMSQSPGGAMVRTPSGTMAYLPPEQVTQGPNVIPVSASNAFTLSMPGAAPGMNGSVSTVAMMREAPAAFDTGVPEGAANAFTKATTSRPVPADFGPPQQYPNAFMIDGMGGAYTRPMALAYDPRIGYVPVGGGYPQQMPMIPMPHPAGQMLATLRGSIMPSEREQAVMMLSQCNWHAEPEAVAAIVIAAKTDPAPAVRVSCVRALARMKVNSMPVYEALLELKTDKEISVRQEAEQTLSKMTKH